MSATSDIIRERKSVRSFDGTPIGASDLARLREYAENITDPFGIPVRFVFLDAEEKGLSSPVISG